MPFPILIPKVVKKRRERDWRKRVIQKYVMHDDFQVPVAIQDWPPTFTAKDFIAVEDGVVFKGKSRYFRAQP